MKLSEIAKAGEASGELTSPNSGLYGKCPNGYVFLVAKLPMELGKAGELAKRAACPSCGATKGIKVASQPQEPVHG